MNSILLTGGLGYIGSNLAIRLWQSGYKVVLIDNLSNSLISKFDLINKKCDLELSFHCVDILESKNLHSVFAENQVEAVIHLAGLKSVEEGETNPIPYYENNVVGSLNLLETMINHDVKKFIFSSSATVYGDPKYIPINEQHPVSPKSVYGHTKVIVERILEQQCLSSDFSSIVLRYFNPGGSNQDSDLGDMPLKKPTNVLPIFADYFCNKRDLIEIYGNDYPTVDGTPVRDFIHILDLVEAHIAALRQLNKIKGYEVFNVGTGTGISIFQLSKIFQLNTKTKNDVVFKKRRPGDVAISVTDPTKLIEKTGWRPKYNVEDIVKSQIEFSLKNGAELAK